MLFSQLEGMNSATTNFLSQYCRDSKKTFAECLEYLKEYITRKESHTTELSRRNANRISSMTDSILDNSSSETNYEKNETYNRIWTLLLLFVNKQTLKLQ